MKKSVTILIVCLLILLPLFGPPVWAEDYRLIWEAAEIADPNINYTIIHYQGERETIPVGNVLSYRISLDPNQNHVFMVIATDRAGLQSNRSNSAVDDKKPKTPRNLEILPILEK